MGDMGTCSVGNQASQAGAELAPGDLADRFNEAIDRIMESGNETDLKSEDIDEQAQAVIDAYDVNGDGELAVSELAVALDITMEQAKKFADQFETQGDGNLTLDAEELSDGIGTDALAGQRESEGSDEAAGGSDDASEAGGESSGGDEAPASDEAPGNSGSPHGSHDDDCGEGGATEGATIGTLFDVMTKILDEDGDGKVQPAEVKAFIEKYAGDDGELTKAELMEALQAEDPSLGELGDEQLSELVDQIDDDGNGKLGEAEIMHAIDTAGQEQPEPTYAEALQTLVDKNGDGTITPDEVEDFYKEYDANENGVISKKELKNALKDGAGIEDIDKDQLKELKDQLDANGKGGISQAEFMNAINTIGDQPEPSYFEALQTLVDQDSDGTITPTEVEDFFKEYDTSENGAIYKSELKKALENGAGIENIDMSQVRALMNQFDVNDKGGISQAEFMNAINQPAEADTEMS